MNVALHVRPVFMVMEIALIVRHRQNIRRAHIFALGR